MTEKAAVLSYECIEQLHTWVHANCPCALENEEFLPGLHVIVEMEVQAALRRQQADRFQHLQTPTMQ